VGDQGVLARVERVTELSKVDELRLLRLADDELRAVLDSLVVVGKAVGERVAGIVGPLDNLDQLALEEVDDAHAAYSNPPWPTSPLSRNIPVPPAARRLNGIPRSRRWCAGSVAPS